MDLDEFRRTVGRPDLPDADAARVLGLMQAMAELLIAHHLAEEARRRA